MDEWKDGKVHRLFFFFSFQKQSFLLGLRGESVEQSESQLDADEVRERNSQEVNDLQRKTLECLKLLTAYQEM